MNHDFVLTPQKKLCCFALALFSSLFLHLFFHIWTLSNLFFSVSVHYLSSTKCKAAEES